MQVQGRRVKGAELVTTRHLVTPWPSYSLSSETDLAPEGMFGARQESPSESSQAPDLIKQVR
jgi:hypothetical protein